MSFRPPADTAAKSATTNSWRPLLGLLLAAVLGMAATVALAQGTTVWDVRQLLATTSQPTLTLLEKDREVARVERSQLERFVEVVDRIGSQFSLEPDVVVFKGENPNAFATRRDGKPVVGVNLPMLRLTDADPDLSAVVVGHEIAHLQLNHMDEGQKRRVAIGVLSVVVGAVAGYNLGKRGMDAAPLMDLAMLGGALASRKFDRDQEREADDLGIKSMHQAGYDVHAAALLWERMNQQGSGGSGWWLSTHPAHAERIATLRQTAIALSPTPRQSFMVAAAVPAQAESAPILTLAAAESTVAGASPAAPGFAGGSPWCAMPKGATAQCIHPSWQACKSSGAECLPRDALGEQQTGHNSTLPTSPSDAPKAPTLSGEGIWCLANRGGPTLCRYDTWSDCNSARRSADSRCLGREAADRELAGTTAPTVVRPPPAVPAPSEATESRTARRLRELQQLKQDGLISESEYQAKRKSILSDL